MTHQEDTVAFKLLFLRYGTPVELVTRYYYHHLNKREYDGYTPIIQFFAEDIMFYELLSPQLYFLPEPYLRDVKRICSRSIGILYSKCASYNITHDDLYVFVKSVLKNKK